MPARNKEKLTPMMRQYWEVRKGLPADALLLFRLGDFYEMFHRDAEEGARLLGITLTRRNDYPMAGIPYHAADNYVGKLLAAGRKVAICDQLEAAQPGKLVKRELTRILTPGTALEESQLDAGRSNHLCALHHDSTGLHAAWLDLSTGDFSVATDARIDNLLPVLAGLKPREIVLEEGQLDRWTSAPHEEVQAHEIAAFCRERPVAELPGYHFERHTGARTVMETLGVLNLDGFGIARDHRALGAAGAVLHYAAENLCAKPENIRAIREYRAGTSLLLDPATVRNLEIFQSARGGAEGSLMEAIDRCRTAPGRRRLESWLVSPTLELFEIERRHGVVGELIAASRILPELQSALDGIRDLHRILGRLQNRLRGPREIGGVRDTLRQLPALRTLLAECPGPGVADISGRILEFPELQDLLDRALNDELPAQVQDGGFIREGYDAELDRLISLTRDNKTWLSELEKSEQDKTGIRSLKVRFNQAFGYFIEVTKANLHLVPEQYIRRSTTVNGERYVTEDLKAKEREILSAEEKSKTRELELFGELVEKILADADALRDTAAALAELDVLAGWAELAREWNYRRPVVDDGDALEIDEGRHPVVEQMMRKNLLGLSGAHAFVPNDTRLSVTDDQILLITGPNMAGKSTYIRQVALITLMAQIGCWTPASSCRIGLVDRIFSRVGASDDLARGNSTFMVEMNETANILNNRSDRSLIILDEIGRGTSTYDGLSIAWAVVEHLHEHPERGPRTLFATHYQELTQLEKALPRLRNYSVSVKEWNDEIVFVRRVVPGAADRSYGIQVARLAGLPGAVIERAKVILERLESDDAAIELPSAGPKARPRKKITVQTADDGQLNLL